MLLILIDPDGFPTQHKIHSTYIHTDRALEWQSGQRRVPGVDQSSLFSLSAGRKDRNLPLPGSV